MAGRTHTQWLEFLKKAADLPIGYTIDDLLWFQTVAKRQYPSLAPLVAACIHLAQDANLKISVEGTDRFVIKKRSIAANRGDLLSILRDPKLFPRNSDLSRLATRLMPNMHAYRFDKMSRGEIALRVLQYLESTDQKTRSQLESALRDAAELPPETEDQRQGFVARWENVIRDMKV